MQLWLLHFSTCCHNSSESHATVSGIKQWNTILGLISASATCLFLGGVLRRQRKRVGKGEWLKIGRFSGIEFHPCYDTRDSTSQNKNIV